MSVRIITGDCMDVLPTLDADSFDCVVTSPPYWGLRDYGVAGQIGLEPTLAEYLETMVGVFRDLRRVLKPTGTCWLNIGDSYATLGGGGKQGLSGQRATRTYTAEGSSKKGVPDGLKAKDLCMVPNRLAILLQDDGWWVRSEIIWHKPNPMPESVTDRPTCSHEKVWLLTKSERYFYDAEAIKETAVAANVGEIDGGAQRLPNGAKANEGRNYRDGKQVKIAAASVGSSVRRMGGFNERWDASEVDGQSFTRNARNVWTIASEPYRGAHYAVMPSALAERCIKAGCPSGGSVLDPFGGAGTTGLVADRLGRHATLIELNPANQAMAADRVTMDAPLFTEVTA